MELGALAGEVDRVHLADAGMLRLVGKVDTLVNRQPINLAELVVDMGAQGADTVRAEGDSFGIFLIEGLILLYKV